MLVNSQDVYSIEVKYRRHPRAIERFTGRKLTHFKRLFPKYQDYRIHLALATFAVVEDVKQMALDQGGTLPQRRGRSH